MVELVGYAAAPLYDDADDDQKKKKKNAKHHGRLVELLDIWEENAYYSKEYMAKLREVIISASSSSSSYSSSSSTVNTTTTTTTKGPGPGKKKNNNNNVPFIMPRTHGDPTTPYYDLPAGNLMPHMLPNSTLPLDPVSIKPLQFLAGPPDPGLLSALQTFLDDVDRMYNSTSSEEEGRKKKRRMIDDDDDEIVVDDMDELGERVVRDERTGEVVDGETYYGWSRGFCQQMKKRNRQYY